MNSWVQHDNLSRETHKEKEFERRKKKDIKEGKKKAKRPFYPISSSFLFEENALSYFNQKCWFLFSRNSINTQVLFDYSGGSKLFASPFVARLGFFCQSVTHSAPLFDTASFTVPKVCGVDVHNKSNPITFGIVPHNNIDDKFTERSSKYFTHKR